MNTIVFDWDGTLLDSRARHTALLRDVCRELDLPITQEMLQGYLPGKLTGLNTVRYLMQNCGFSEAAAESCSALWAERIESWEYLEQDVLYPDTRWVLESLRSKGDLELVLLTARQSRELLTRQLEQFGVLRFFSRVFCVSPTHAKEEKQRAVEDLEHIVCVVGDTEIDYWAAMHAGCPFYAMARGFRSGDYWRSLSVEPHGDLSGFRTYWETE